MDGYPIHEFLFPVDGVVVLAVEQHNGFERAIGQQAKLGKSGVDGLALGSVQQKPPDAPALRLRRNRNILDPDVIVMPHRFDQADDLAILDGNIELMLPDGLVVVGSGSRPITGTHLE
jgi:hypothetical protein